MFDISPIQILIVLVIALLVFGPKRLPEMGKSIGRGIREFKGAMLDDEEPRRAPAPRAEEPAPPAPPAPSPAAATATMSRPDDDVLDGVVVPGDAPPRADDRTGA
ncbi:MAG TPA: twin-arginine translocase TatA/TatE family subunit [Miltoncostaeaceae bacterium]|nr:twin-arginine translocase TatA/TatE family subunit [Miltoncostaeaceae bacterium]